MRNKLLERIESHYERKLDKFNEAMLLLGDHMQPDESECEQLIDVINEHLLGETNRVAYHLRKALCLSIDVIASEDCLVKLRGIEE